MGLLKEESSHLSISAVDMFCGVGGLTYGLQQAGINVVAGLDVDETCKYAFEENNEADFISKDIRKFTSAELLKLYPEKSIKLLVGCAPCQPFSAHTRKNKNRSSDERWSLLDDFGKLIEEVKPELIAFENVPLIRKEDIFTNFCDKLRSLDYHFDPELIVDCPDYGIPQKRRRLVLIASIWGEVELIPKTHSCSLDDGLLPFTTVKDTIGVLPIIDDGEEDEQDRLHRSRKLTDNNKERIKQSKPGGTWKDWDEELRLECHKKPSGKGYTTVYGRMEWGDLAPTITTQFINLGSGRFGHPEQDRALSLREGALLQSFPKDYKFIQPESPITVGRIAAYIGNAVPVQLAKVIGESIQKHVKKYAKGEPYNVSDDYQP